MNRNQKFPVEGGVHLSSTNRRAVLGAIGTAGLAALAGCAGDDEQNDGNSESPVTEEPWLPREIRVGGTLSVAVPYESPVYDPVATTEKTEVTHLLYDRLVQFSSRSRETYTWLAKSITQTNGDAAQWPSDYLEYTTPYEIIEIKESKPQFDLDETNLVVGVHPTDEQAIAEGDLTVGDSMRLLTRNEATDAAGDGRYAQKLEITLWEGVQFHDGEELTAGNVVNSYDRIATGDLASKQFESLLAVEAPNGPDGYEVTLYAREPEILPGLALQPLWIFPSAHIDSPPGALDPGGDEVPIGCGPYRVAELDNDQATLVKHEEYWLNDIGLESFDWWDDPDREPRFPTSPVVDEIRVQTMPGYEERYDAITGDEVDVGFDFTESDLGEFHNSEGFANLVPSGTPGHKSCVLQLPVTAETETPLRLQGCRRAISTVLSREELAAVFDNRPLPAYIPLPAPRFIFDDRSYDELKEEPWVPTPGGDPDQAGEYLDQSGVDIPVEFNIVVDMGADRLITIATKLATLLSETEYFAVDVKSVEEVLSQGQTLREPNVVEQFAKHDAGFLFECAPGNDPDDFVRNFHHPVAFGTSCNYLHPPGTFEWQDKIDQANRELARRDKSDRHTDIYIDLWKNVLKSSGTIYLLHPRSMLVSNRQRIGSGGETVADPEHRLERLVYNPYHKRLLYLDDDELPLLETVQDG